MNPYRSSRIVFPVVTLGALLAGCNKHSAQNTQPEPAPAQGPVQSFVGGPSAPAQSAVRRGMEIQKAKGHFTQLKLFHAQYKTEQGKPPASLKDFLAYMQRDDPTLAKLLQDGVIAMNFKQNAQNDALLAYVNFEDGAGNRAVLRENGVIEVLNAQAFAEAQKK